MWVYIYISHKNLGGYYYFHLGDRNSNHLIFQVTHFGDAIIDHEPIFFSFFFFFLHSKGSNYLFQIDFF